MRRTLALLNVDAAGAVRHLAARTPAVLPPEAWGAWLSPTAAVPELRRLLRPYPGERLVGVVVGPAVNDPTRDGPECEAPGGRPDHVRRPFG